MTVPDGDRFVGCLLGLALADALGAPHEGGLPERLLWRAIGRTRDGRRRYTDDTQMALDLAESLLAVGRLDADDLASRLAAGYAWSRGYGRGTARVLRRVARGEDWQRARLAAHREGSFGNGGALRAPVVALFFAARPGEVEEAARRQAEVTHAHALGSDAAAAVAAATSAALLGGAGDGLLQRARAACHERSLAERLALVAGWEAEGKRPAPREVVRRLGNGVAALDSCATALHAAARHLEAPFEDLLGFVRACRGDVDSIGAMAGAVWGARRGAAALPAASLDRLEHRERLEAIATSLRAVAGRTSSAPGRGPGRRGRG